MLGTTGGFRIARSGLSRNPTSQRLEPESYSSPADQIRLRDCSRELANRYCTAGLQVQYYSKDCSVGWRGEMSHLL